MTHRCTLTVTVAELADLAAVIAAVEGLGHVVECPAYDARERLRVRDELLREAHGLMSGMPWARCVALEKEIARFEAIQWPRLRDHDAPPEPSSRLRSLLFRARRLGPLPTTARQLWNIVMKRSGRGDFRQAPLKSTTQPE